MPSPLPYSYIPWKGPIPAPAPSANGGLFTGAAAAGPWGAVPVSPDPIALADNLASANPPPSAAAHIPTAPRPGNNAVDLSKFYQPYEPTRYPTVMCLK